MVVGIGVAILLLILNVYRYDLLSPRVDLPQNSNSSYNHSQSEVAEKDELDETLNNLLSFQSQDYLQDLFSTSGGVLVEVEIEEFLENTAPSTPQPTLTELDLLPDLKVFAISGHGGQTTVLLEFAGDLKTLHVGDALDDKYFLKKVIGEQVVISAK